MNQLVKLVGESLHLHLSRWILASHTPAKKRAKNMNQQLQRLDRKRVLPEASEISMSTVKHLHPSLKKCVKDKFERSMAML
ncbi:hypothetical protein [Prosthecobacter sp.]|uniref:hypothetical protein n=1 Tax=Prosthecobacter sp. TaxID=1965333 RepID=UPI001DA8EF2E|nr:hypothetical protein [Prosthecobacter sp.]MCB1274976.1 hypothetical protein [Prosthecobacter sp.]